MDTTIYIMENIKDHKEVVEEIAEALRQGETVVFPTETVYGLGANALDPDAAKKIYAAKGRPSDNPLILHISSMEMLEEVAEEISFEARKLAEVFWPGPLTMIFRKKKIVPHETTGGLNTVAVRMPAHPLALALIEAAGIPIAAPSANLSGRPSITTGYHAMKEMDGRVNRILLGRKSSIGLESTVLDMTRTPPTILRPGRIGPLELKKYIEFQGGDPLELQEQDPPKSPGMKYTHYSPKAKLYVLKPGEKNGAQKIRSMALEAEKTGQKVVIFCRTSHQEEYEKEEYEGDVFEIGETGDQIAYNLFQALREADESEADLILSEDFYDEKDEMSKVVMDRLRKAATEE